MGEIPENMGVNDLRRSRVELDMTSLPEERPAPEFRDGTNTFMRRCHNDHGERGRDRRRSGVPRRLGGPVPPEHTVPGGIR
jgi:hypothetical protein